MASNVAFADHDIEPLEWYNSLLRYCLKLTKNIDDAKDLCQQTYAIYYERKYEGGSILYTVAMHQFLNYKNSIIGKSYHDPETAIPSVIYDADAYDMEYYSKYIAGMGVKGSALKLFNEGYSLKEIAGIQNIPIDTVKTRIFKARTQLKSTL